MRFFTSCIVQVGTEEGIVVEEDIQVVAEDNLAIAMDNQVAAVMDNLAIVVGNLVKVEDIQVATMGNLVVKSDSLARVDLDIITMACHTQMVDRDILVARNLVQLNSLVVVEDMPAIGGIVVKDKKVRLEGIIEDNLVEA